ncbi:hypothetical protein E0H93_28165 [Rhizobium leguminosarum bv. viciae]|uniref:calcium-binding protein n=1 Tax=Rhizobium leguminosarum TaxID=384 RepID=UPI00103CA802|nr:calcium-binding protein [Rhizobium leguminosarum]TBY26963.1 hypothetical protein E0H55_28965 [Rhizobium leguminosarum bv. viciae]TCA99528.1 hypothetical protein E0H93_28165 [Rhizobium leguminosarum bv. viciae]
MAYQFTGSELSALQNAYNNAVAGGSWATVYSTISASISTNGQPEAGVDQAVLSWVNGAQQVNAGVGDFSHFIRQYSTAQYVLRFGEASQTSLQVVSDAVARRVADDILSTGELPSLAVIGSRDAGETIALYFNNDKGGWSGNSLFMFLGDDSFFRDSILHTTDANDPAAGDPYDFWTFVGSSMYALGGIEDLIDLAKQVYQTMAANGVGVLGTFTTVFKAMWDSDAMLHQAYGLYTPSILSSYQLDLGTQNHNDEINLDNDHQWLSSGGKGDDTIIGGSRGDIVDGGLGTDVLQGGGETDVVVGNAGDDVLVGGRLININRNTSIDMTTNHAEWNDGAGDELRGGFGNDRYLVRSTEGDTWDWASLYDFDDQKASELLNIIDTIDETSGDGVGEILIQMEYPSQEPELQFQQVAVAGSYTFASMDQFDRVAYYYNGQNSVALYNVTDEFGESIPYLFVLAGYPPSPVVAIKNFYQGDFGIVLSNYDRERAEQDSSDIGQDFHGSATADVFHGGAGSDSADYSGSDDGVDINLSVGTAAGGFAEGDTLLSIERVTGSNYGDHITGNDRDNFISGGDGDDVIISGAGFDYLDGGSGDDQITIGLGDKLVDGGAGTDLAVFGFNRDQYAAALDGGFVSIIGSGVDVTFSNVEVLRFADGDVLVDELFGTAIVGTSGNDILTGTTGADVMEGLDGDDEFDGLVGDDQLYGGHGNDFLNGGEGSDVYHYASGDGNDTISDVAINLEETDVLRFSDLNLGSLTFTRSGEDLFITINATGEVITVETQYYSAGQGWALEKLVFADGTSLELDHMPDTNWIYGTTASETIDGNWGKDYIFAGKGDDIINGSAGSDIYFYASGDGSDVINDEVGFTDAVDVIRFSDIDFNDFSIKRHGDDLELTIAGTTDVITLKGQMYEDPGDWGVDKIEFADGTSLSRAAIIQLGLNAEDTVTAQGTAGEDTLTGTSAHDLIQGGHGNDYLFGGYGGDTYLYSLGDGSDYIDDEANSQYQTDILKFTDLNQSDIGAERDGVNLKLTVLSTGDSITLDEEFYSSSEYWGIERIEFADGSFWDRNAILSIGEAAASIPNPISAPKHGPLPFDGTIASAEVLAFPGSTLEVPIADHGQSAAAAGEGAGSISATEVATAEIISFSDFLDASEHADAAADLWFEPEPIGAVI